MYYIIIKLLVNDYDRMFIKANWIQKKCKLFYFYFGYS